MIVATASLGLPLGTEGMRLAQMAMHDHPIRSIAEMVVFYGLIFGFLPWYLGRRDDQKAKAR